MDKNTSVSNLEEWQVRVWEQLRLTWLLENSPESSLSLRSLMCSICLSASVFKNCSWALTLNRGCKEKVHTAYTHYSYLISLQLALLIVILVSLLVFSCTASLKISVNWNVTVVKSQQQQQQYRLFTQIMLQGAKITEKKFQIHRWRSPAITIGVNRGIWIIRNTHVFKTYLHEKCLASKCKLKSVTYYYSFMDTSLDWPGILR